MTRDGIIARLKQATPLLRAEGVARLAIFGSRAHGDAREDSDFDVLIDVDPAGGHEGLRLVGVIADAERMAAAATGLRTEATVRAWPDRPFAERIADDVI